MEKGINNNSKKNNQILNSFLITLISFMVYSLAVAASVLSDKMSMTVFLEQIKIASAIFLIPFLLSILKEYIIWENENKNEKYDIDEQI